MTLRASILFRGAAVLGLAEAIAGCGDGGGSGGSGTVAVLPAPAPAPAPSPTPTPSQMGATDRLIGGTLATQAFADEGRYLTDGGLTVRFNASTANYLVTYPGNTTPVALIRDPQAQGQNPWSSFLTADQAVYVLTRASPEAAGDRRYQFSNLAAWGFRTGTPGAGATAFGIATSASAVPRQGTIIYIGFLEGISTETYRSEGATINGLIDGSVTLTFDFGRGTATIAVTPRLGLAQYSPLESLTQVRLEWAVGSTTFFQPNADPNSKNFPISGRFTGPNAEELIGGISIGYRSPVDGSMQTASGAFIASAPRPVS